MTLWPALLALVPNWRAGTPSNMRMVGLLLVAFAIPQAIFIAWRQYKSAGLQLDAVLQGSPSERQRLAEWLRRWLRPLPQLLACLLSALTLSALCWALKLATLSLLAAVAVFVTGLAVGQALYLNVFTVLLGRIIRDLPGVSVMWLNPFATPGMVNLNRAVQTQARAGLGLLALVSLPLTYAYLGRHTVGAALAYLVMLGLAAGSVVIIGITVQVWLGEPIRRERARILGELSAEVEADAQQLDSTQEDAQKRLKSRLELFQQVAASPTSFWGTGSLLRYIAAATPMLAQLIAGSIAAELK